MVLLRHLLGDVLRRLRLRQGRTLREVSAAARVSLGYLSEVERGQKEASSELLAAICTALSTPLSHVLGEVSDSFALAELQNEPAARARAHPGRCARAASPAGRSAAARRRPAVPMAAPLGARSASCSCRSPGRSPPSSGREAPGPGRACPGHGLRAGPRPGRLNEDHPAFDEVTRRVRDLGDMVPV